MLQNDHAEDFVIGTGETHSVKEFLDAAFSYVGLDMQEHVRIDKRYFRPTEVESLLADSRKASKEMKWKPLITFEDLVKIMVDADMRTAGLQPIGEGDQILKNKFPNRWWRRD